MTTKKRKVTAKAKVSSRRHKKATAKALRRGVKNAKKPARKRVHTRTALGSKESVPASAPTVAVYEVIETEVYQEPVFEADDQEEGFGT